MPLTIRTRVLVVSATLAALGWSTAALLTAYVVKLKASEAIAEHEATNWRRKAGKAYTELLTARPRRSDGTIIVPAGTIIRGSTAIDASGHPKINFDGVLYPPANY
jgi:hypothetical protein